MSHSNLTSTEIDVAVNDYRLLVLINALSFGAMGISAPQLSIFFEEELGADKARIALILTSISIVLLISNYAWGRISDWLGQRKPIWAGGLFGVAVMSFLVSQAPNITAAWILRAGHALSLAAYTTLSLAIITDVFERTANTQKPLQKGRRMGFYRGLGSLAFAIGATLGGTLADLISLRAIFIAVAVLYLLAGLCALFLSEKKLEKGAGEISAPQKHPSLPTNAGTPHPTGQQLPLLFLAGVALWTMAHTASATMWPNYMRSLGYSKSAVGSLWGLAALIEFPAMYLAGIVSDIAGTVIVLAAGGILVAVVNLGYLLFATFLPALLSIQVIRGFGFATYTTTAMTFTTDFGAQSTRGRTSGTFYTTTSIGFLLGSYFGGTFAEWRGFEFMYGFCAISALAAGACFLLLRRNVR